MSEMVERVAKAIEDADIENGCDYIGMARAAIAAMREPTSGMISASAKCNIEPEMMLHKQRWKAMIDEALK